MTPNQNIDITRNSLMYVCILVIINVIKQISISSQSKHWYTPLKSLQLLMYVCHHGHHHFHSHHQHHHLQFSIYITLYYIGNLKNFTVLWSIWKFWPVQFHVFEFWKAIRRRTNHCKCQQEILTGHCPQRQIQGHTNTNETANTHTNTNTIQGHQASHKSWQVQTRKGRALLSTVLKYKYKFIKKQLKLQIHVS